LREKLVERDQIGDIDEEEDVCVDVTVSAES
jgi:hypothetical protein